MRIFPQAIVLIIIVMFFSSCHPGTNWRQFTSNEGDFTIYMPENPRLSQKLENTPFGKQNTFFVTWKPDAVSLNKLLMLQVSYTHCPPNLFQDSVLMDVMLDSSIKMKVSDFTDRTVTTQTILFNGYPGRAFIYEMEDGKNIAIVKECIVNDRKYDVTVIAKGNYSTTKEIDDFFNSFKVLR